MHDTIAAKRAELAEVCRRYDVIRLEVFGSALHEGAFDPERSDIDLLVEFSPEAEDGLSVLLDLEEALRNVLGRDVDLIERQSIEHSRNYIRRRRILQQAEPVYVAR